ncbi:MAG TPA: Glu-tRNA(Gln) amidotransferase subunit GatD, partial [Thermoanaerobaculia bacterium]|nr:Glu-tRNA(Gln) amidotransferase subunit GatD [Thermoanaerobaculia bacterium]
MNDPLKGYKGHAREVLLKFGVKVWSDVRATNDAGSVFEGVILPRSESFDDLHVVMKLKNGYNVGLHVDRLEHVIEVGYKEAKYKIPEKEFPSRPKLPKVTLLGTGGTIASRLDYRTGAVIPAFTPGELYGAVPELADICNLTTKKIFGVFSENMAKENYLVLANAIGEEIAAGADGIVIGHGTDTMGHTAAILSFMVQNTPVPIVLVGSQRSSDRPSSDAALNLIHSVRTAAYSDIAEVVISMFGPTSDRYGLLHRGTRCRKMHSSYRSTFRTIGDIPLAMVGRDSFTILNDDYHRRDRTRVPVIDAVYDDRTTILYYYPGMKPDLVDALVEKGYRGIVIAGTGLGHVNKPLYPAL